MIIVYTDGSCSKNPGPGGFGVVAVDNETGVVVDAYSEKESNTTNNRMEMKAILYAVEHYGEVTTNEGFQLATPTVIYSDSSYCVNSFTDWIHGWKANGWTRAGGKKLENLDLIQMYDLLSKSRAIDLRKIKGHAGEIYNELADALATGRMSVEEVLRDYGE